MIRTLSSAVLVLCLGFGPPAFADEAAPIAPDSPEANGAASPSTVGHGIANDGSSANVSTTTNGSGTAPSVGSLGANDPAEGVKIQNGGNPLNLPPIGKTDAAQESDTAQ